MTGRTPSSRSDSAGHPTFKEAFRFWLKLGFISFGGPTGQIAIMHTELVDKKRWISEARFLHALNYCMLLPGPEAQQLATYIGWLLHRTWGGIVAGGLFVLPSVAILWLLSYIYVAHGNVPWIEAVFYGLKPTVLAIVAAAVIRIGRRALKNSVMWAIAGTAFIAIFFLRIPFPIIIVTAGAIGLLGYTYWPARFKVLKPYGQRESVQASVIDDEHGVPDHAKQSLSRSFKIIAVCATLWWTPVALIFLWLGAVTRYFTRACFSVRRHWSRSVEHMPCFRTSRSKRWNDIVGLRRGKCSTAWGSRKQHRDR